MKTLFPRGPRATFMGTAIATCVDGTSTLSWRAPSATFAPYRSAKLEKLARELDPVFEAIARDAGR